MTKCAIVVMLWLVWGNALALSADDPHIAELLASGNYDRALCATAQRIILHADANLYRLHTLRASDTFITEQMNTDAVNNSITVAALPTKVRIGRQSRTVAMACKLVNQARVRDQLNLKLPSPAGTCRDVNQLTYALALNSLNAEQREHFLANGTPLQFSDDYRAAAGGEWLPAVVSDFISAHGDKPDYLNVQAPSVQVPWPSSGGDWYQGTNHCKVITLAAMRSWMKAGAFDGSRELFPRPVPRCTEPSSRTSVAGSCLLYFGPAGAQFCQDYSGSNWNEASARADCAVRHPNQAAWEQNSASYAGSGGVYSTASCVSRNAAAEAARPPNNVMQSAYRGTCVFRCNTPDEALWHQLSPLAGDPDGRGLARSCDLFLKIDW